MGGDNDVYYIHSGCWLCASSPLQMFMGSSLMTLKHVHSSLSGYPYGDGREQSWYSRCLLWPLYPFLAISSLSVAVFLSVIVTVTVHCSFLRVYFFILTYFLSFSFSFSNMSPCFFFELLSFCFLKTDRQTDRQSGWVTDTLKENMLLVLSSCCIDSLHFA